MYMYTFTIIELSLLDFNIEVQCLNKMLQLAEVGHHCEEVEHVGDGQLRHERAHLLDRDVHECVEDEVSCDLRYVVHDTAVKLLSQATTTQYNTDSKREGVYIQNSSH